MGIQDIDHRFLFESKLEEDTLKVLWKIYYDIHDYWHDPKKMSVNVDNHYNIFVSFILNRIRIKPEYVEYYKIGVSVYNEYIDESKPSKSEPPKPKLDKSKLHQKLFVTPAANIHPYSSAKSMFKQKVINEFITFYLASGGFKIFNPDTETENSNYAGYIGGENINLDDSKSPYLTYEKNKQYDI